MMNRNLWLPAPIVSILLVIFSAQLIFSSSVSAQNISNRGSEFWAVFPTHVPDIDKQFNVLNANLSLFITSPQPSSGTVSVGSFSEHFSVTANGITEIAIPRAAAYINDTEAGKVLSNRAVHIMTDAGMPDIVVYAHIFAGQRSAASLILPQGSLGQQCYSMNFPEYDSEGQNFIVVAASEPNTRIRIRRGNTDLVPGGVLLNNTNDVYEYLSADDLTGVLVTVDSLTSACKHFAMFSGSSGLYIPSPGCTPMSIDPLFQQCYPLTDWGTAYGFIPFSTQSTLFKHPVRTEGQLLRIIASKNATVVKINGSTVATLNAGNFYSTPKPINVPSNITASAPVAVAQYALTQSCSNAGTASGSDTSGYSDPDMVLLNPLQYGIKDITAYSSTRENISEQYINVLISTAAVPGFRINGKPAITAFKTSSTLPGLSYAQLNVTGDSTKVFHLQADSSFNAIAYGFGNVESYSYSAGTSLSGNGDIKAIRTADGVTIDSACVEENYYFSLTLPHKASSISWKMDANESAIVQNNPSCDSVSVLGVFYYLYKLKKTAAYSTPGKHIIKVNAVYTLTIGGCVDSGGEFDSDFTVIAPPAVRFVSAADSCLLNHINFTGIQSDLHSVITAWRYDFGDHSPPGNNQSVQHIYSKDGDYIVQLTVTSSAGCQATYQDTVHIRSGILPGISVSVPACAGAAISLSDVSKTSGFTVSSRKWYFGDSDSLTTQGSTVNHAYLFPGKYTIKLLLISDKGCSSDTIIHQVTISNFPQPDFSLPAICVSDKNAQFKNNTQDDSGTLTYLWRFGDQAQAGNSGDTSTLQNPTHHYTTPGSYQVSLTATNNAGCANTITKTLVVNGSAIKADFAILNGPAICQGQSAVLQDLSKVDFGKVIRRDWMITDGKNVIASVTDTTGTDPPVTIPLNIVQALPGDITLQVKLRAYSGNMCQDSTIQSVTVLPAPSLKFDSLKTVCVSAPAFQINEATVGNGITGTGFYKGEGIISPQGLFAPSTAGVGSHVITYIFTSAGGCTDSITAVQNVVTDPGVVGRTITIEQGENVRLIPVYAGQAFTYHWSPSKWLDNDGTAFPLASPKDSITYTVTVSNGTCTASGEIQVMVLKPPVIYNSFTPNGDGINDVWNIPYLKDDITATVDIFNRYGSLIYHSAGYSRPWDGTYHEQPVPAGTYYYLIKTRKKSYSGSVTVLR